MKEARAVEAALMRRLQGVEDNAEPVPTAPPPPRPAVPTALTVRDGITKAKGILWSGQTTEHESFRKLERIASIVGDALPLDSFDVNNADSIVMKLRDEGCSDSTINRYISCVSAFLRFCKRRGLRTCDLPELEWRDEDETRIRWLTAKEEAQLCGILPDPYNDLVYIAVRTGLRATELLTLKPDQVTPAWVHLWKTKNGHARSVPISADVYQRLAPLVTKGLMPDYWQLRNEWDYARKAMGLEHDKTFVFHACRHTYATRAVQAEVNLRVLQQLLGHRTIQTTLRYAHVEDKTLSDAVQKMTVFHADKSPPKGGANGPKCPTPRTEGSVYKPQKSAPFRKPSASPAILQIRIRRFDSGSGLHLIFSELLSVFESGSSAPLSAGRTRGGRRRSSIDEHRPALGASVEHKPKCPLVRFVTSSGTNVRITCRVSFHAEGLPPPGRSARCPRNG
ncbi:Site-specific recombinase XerD [Novosphingobium mathurense]|uniref:Site-specific recombinase XerD n=2 Tax=Novosphingobium mathurense TaxID=428990 RepID=A0A1U6HK08_9SPHN|nr:Site-specific recombinase XerD [Novosphingobium mathurense]